METATEKQLNALKRFAENPEISSKVLGGVDIGGLGKQEARELISRCFECQKELNLGKGFRLSFSQNYRNGDGSFKTVILSDGELAAVRKAHKEHCEQVMRDCSKSYPGDKEVQLSIFDKRCDKIFTWIQQALDGKVRDARGKWELWK